MKTNGVVRRLVSSPPGLERWEAQCLLCPWRPGKRRLYASKSAAELGDWDALKRDSQVEPEEAPGRRARSVSPEICLLGSGKRFTREKSYE